MEKIKLVLYQPFLRVNSTIMELQMLDLKNKLRLSLCVRVVFSILKTSDQNPAHDTILECWCHVKKNELGVMFGNCCVVLVVVGRLSPFVVVVSSSVISCHSYIEIFSTRAILSAFGTRFIYLIK